MKSIKEARSPKKLEPSVSSPMKNDSISERSASVSSQEIKKSEHPSQLQQEVLIEHATSLDHQTSTGSIQEIQEEDQKSSEGLETEEKPICLETNEVQSPSFQSPSRISRLKKKEKYGIGNFYNNDDLKRMGTKILEEVGKNPEKYRMGDILHLV